MNLQLFTVLHNVIIAPPPPPPFISIDYIIIYIVLFISSFILPLYKSCLYADSIYPATSLPLPNYLAQYRKRG